MTDRPARLSIGFVLAEHFTLSAFSLFVDQLRLAADEGDRSRPILCRWQVMTGGDDWIASSTGIRVQGDGGFADPRQFDYVVVVGGVLHQGRQIDDAAIAYIRRAGEAGVRLIGLCTGSFILCRLGLMAGRRVCISWYHAQDFREEFPDLEPVADRLFIEDGDRITCAGGGGVADLASFLIDRHIGPAVAQKCRHIAMLDRARQGSEAQPHPPTADRIGDDRVRRALLLMEQHLTDPLPIADIAARLELSTRQLERLFQGVIGLRPGVYYRELRLRYAQWLLHNTTRSITDIALEAGFADCAHFSRHFKALHGATPSDARARARPGEAVPMAGHRVFG